MKLAALPSCDIQLGTPNWFLMITPSGLVNPVTNEIITLVKDTSLAFALAYTEMFTLAKQIAASQTSLLPLFIAGVFYYVFNFVVAYVMETLENKLNYYH